MTSTCSVDIIELPYKPWESDLFLTPGWRHEDAQRLVAGEEPMWSEHDPAILDCVEYLKALADAHGEQELAAVRSRWPTLSAAHEIAQQGGPQRWEIEARLLARQSNKAIGAKCGLPPDVVCRYESVFFNVRPRLGARMWVCHQVIGPGLHNGFGDHEVGPLWADFAFFGGPVIFDALLDAWHVAWRSGDPVTLSSYLRSGADIDTRLLATVAAYVLPPYEPMGTLWNKVYLRLCESDQMDDPDRRALLQEQARDYLIQCARAYLAGKLLPETRWRSRESEDRDHSATGVRNTGMSAFARQIVLWDFADSIEAVN